MLRTLAFAPHPPAPAGLAIARAMRRAGTRLRDGDFGGAVGKAICANVARSIASARSALRAAVGRGAEIVPAGATTSVKRAQKPPAQVQQPDQCEREAGRPER